MYENIFAEEWTKGKQEGGVVKHVDKIVVCKLVINFRICHKFLKVDQN